ncbi:PTPRA [Bugula neritina]|uniref:protein-tyrosine-phosphatase n=1 Tax=Bugula neritina TaxID=10212 RepID=A0A7J7JQP6_BUGNE|nr:PTPRA [Bugula neritina]
MHHLQNKCEQYWPLDKQPKTFGDITVCSKSVECWADFTQTRLSISKDNQTRTLSHFNYLSWPDHGVPDDLSSYVAFYFKIKSLVSRSTSPLLIHCSAGVGRTGTYIALEYLIQQAKREEAVDVFGCVEAMRKRRPCMVQKDDQYIFLHEVLAESLAVEGFKCFPLEINDKIDAYKRGETGNQSKSILQEFQVCSAQLHLLKINLTQF